MIILVLVSMHRRSVGSGHSRAQMLESLRKKRAAKQGEKMNLFKTV
jgi:hypothetical protein